MRYTKTALLAFGSGLLLGLAIIAAEIKSLERVASALMALGIAGIPVGMVADWRRAIRAAAAGPKRGAKVVAPRTSHARRPRKSTVPKR
jgi:xanthosine utilization system XapX-like protein